MVYDMMRRSARLSQRQNGQEKRCQEYRKSLNDAWKAKKIRNSVVDDSSSESCAESPQNENTLHVRSPKKTIKQYNNLVKVYNDYNTERIDPLEEADGGSDTDFIASSSLSEDQSFIEGSSDDEVDENSSKDNDGDGGQCRSSESSANDNQHDDETSFKVVRGSKIIDEEDSLPNTSKTSRNPLADESDFNSRENSPGFDVPVSSTPLKREVSAVTCNNEQGRSRKKKVWRLKDSSASDSDSSCEETSFYAENDSAAQRRISVRAAHQAVKKLEEQDKFARLKRKR